MAPYIAFRVCYRRLLIPASVKESPGLPAAPPSPFQPLPPPSDFPPPPPPSLSLTKRRRNATLYHPVAIISSALVRWAHFSTGIRATRRVRVRSGPRRCVFDRPWTGERWTVIGSEKGWLHGSVEREGERESR